MVERFTYDRLLGVVQGVRVIDLYPYKIKNRELFIHRDHIPYNPDKLESRKYAQETTRRAVEGLWVNDEGTHIFMPPKLFFFTNLGTIETDDDQGRDRYPQYPRLRDNEWITFTYLLCCDGFSGFEDDPDFTCNLIIRDIEDGLEVPDVVRKTLKPSCYRKDGTYKKYVEAWDYLTWFYHKVNPRDFPLGRALYDNDVYNFLWLATRGWGKTFSIAGGDASHEMWTNGATSYESLKKKLKVNMFMGASDSKFINTFMGAMQLSFTNIPGVDHAPHKYFTKSATNTWLKEREPVIQQYRRADNTFGGSQSQIGKAVIQINKPDVVVSTRSRRIYVDEVGLVENFRKVHEAADSTLKSTKGKFGMLLGMGTGGFVEKIVETKAIYYSPRQYGIYAIPNYWEGGPDCGLFGPASYRKDVFKDPQGNTRLIEATEDVFKQRKEKRKGTDGISAEIGMRQNEPVIPSEIFLSGDSKVFLQEVVVDRMAVLQAGLFKSKAKVYELELGKPYLNGETPMYDVIAKKVDNKWDQIITDWAGQENKEGGLVVFEPPMPDGREFLEVDNLYKVFMDPKTDLETGESFTSIKVWKGLPKRAIGPDEMFNNIVASAKVKEGGNKLFLLLCLWYRARGQYERNVSGIPDFFDKYQMGWILQPSPIRYMKDVTPGTKQKQSTGIVMNKFLKPVAFSSFREFHREIVHVDGLGRAFRNVETWYDLDLLSEMAAYGEGNFDSISAMLILMVWFNAERIPADSSQSGEAEDLNEWEELASAAKQIVGM